MSEVQFFDDTNVNLSTTQDEKSTSVLNNEDMIHGLRRVKSAVNLRKRRRDLFFGRNPNGNVEVHKNTNNYRFGFKKWKGHVTQRPLHIRSETIQSLYADVNKIQLDSAHKWIVFDILYVILFGWWQSLVYLLLGVLMYLTIIGRHYGAYCFKMSKYFLWPFRKYVYVVPPFETLDTNNSNESGSYADDEERQHLLDNNVKERQPLLHKPTCAGCCSFWRKLPSYVWLILAMHLLVVIHTVVMAISWLFVISIPIAKMNLKSIKYLLFLPPENIRVEGVDEYGQDSIVKNSEIIMFIPKSVNLYYYKYTLDGMNIILVNLLLFVVLTIVFGYLDVISSPLKCVLGVLAIIPLTYYIGMAIISISAQTSVAIGAVINATFGSIVEIIIFVVALNKGKQDSSQECFTEIVKATLTGTIIGCTLLIPGLCMIIGGLKYTSQSFNTKSANVSCLLMFVCVAGVFAPTLFSRVLGDMNCKTCQNIYSPNSTLKNMTVYGLDCEQCTNSIFGLEKNERLYNKHIKPIVYSISLMLPLAYIIGLVFTLKTHSAHLTEEFTEEQEERDDNHEGNGHGSPEWSILKSLVILLCAATLIGICADIVTENIKDFLNETGMSTYFVGVTFLAMIPALPEIVNGMQFALQNNVNLGIEVGTSVAIQVCTIEVPLLVLIDIIYPFQLYMVFNEVHLWSVLFAVIVINYTFQDGKSDYFQGTVLLFIYLILVCMYYFMPSIGC